MSTSFVPFAPGVPSGHSSSTFSPSALEIPAKKKNEITVKTIIKTEFVTFISIPSNCF
jgi:hypothetical protein